MLLAIRRCFRIQTCRLFHIGDSMTYYIALPKSPAYFETPSTDSEEKQQTDTPEIDNASVLSSPLRKTFVVAEVARSDATDVVSDYISSCLSLNGIFQSARAVAECEVALGARRVQLPGNKVQLHRCVFLFSRTEDQSSLKSLLSSATLPERARLYSFTRCGSGDTFQRRSFSTLDSVEEEQVVVRLKQSAGAHGDGQGGEAPGVAPMLASSEFSPVFHSMQRTLHILNNVSDMAEVGELLEIGRRELPQDLDVHQLQSRLKHPFVVVEGMDATGKTTLTEKLEARLDAARYYTPPPCIQHLRRFFDKMPEIVRRAYYCLGNYIVSVQIARECETRAAIMDRFWHSTAAYGVANETSLSDLPPPGHMTYSWPTDLLRPTSVLFLTVSEEVRKQRMSDRDRTMTVEEVSLDRDSLFRQRLCLAYRRMRSPECTEIDAAGQPEQVAEKALAALQEVGVTVTVT